VGKPHPSDAEGVGGGPKPPDHPGFQKNPGCFTLLKTFVASIAQAKNISSNKFAISLF